MENAAFDAALETVADFGDIKSPWFLNHSRDVASLAARAGDIFGLPMADRATLRRAALVHDIGKVGISAGTWGNAGPLSESEWEAVRLHPYHTGRVFARSPALAPIGALAALHHERLDGSGYYRSLPAMLPAASRVLAAANRFRSLVESRAHRATLAPEKAARQLQDEAKQGLLDEDAVAAVLNAADESTPALRREAATQLSAREKEVLRLLAHGDTMKAVADQLHVAYETIDRHVQNIYTKIGVNTRAGATLRAVEHGLT